MPIKVAYPMWLSDSVNIAKQTLEWLNDDGFKDYNCSTSMFSEKREFSFFVNQVASCLEAPMLNDTALAVKHLDEACTDLISQLSGETQVEFSYRVLRMMRHLDKALTKYDEIRQSLPEDELAKMYQRYRDLKEKGLVA